VRVDSKDRIKIVINRFLKKSDLSIKEAEESVKSDIFWLIPNDYKTTMSAINQGKALNDISPKAPITRNLAELADNLLGRVAEDAKKKKRGKGLFKK
jgi:pilus assembly protein CpaE